MASTRSAPLSQRKVDGLAVRASWRLLFKLCWVCNEYQLYAKPETDSKNAHVYVCGDGAKMAPPVRLAFLDIYCARTGSDESQARYWLIGLVESDHYVEDVWAG